MLIPVGAKIGEEASTLAGKLPEALKEDPLSRFPLPAWLEQWRPRMTEFRLLGPLAPASPPGAGAAEPVVGGLGRFARPRRGPVPDL